MSMCSEMPAPTSANAASTPWSDVYPLTINRKRARSCTDPLSKSIFWMMFAALLTTDASPRPNGLKGRWRSARHNARSISTMPSGPTPRGQENHVNRAMNRFQPDCGEASAER